jgi:ubiquinone/menaquinone biosynthesis C-methylase UbiE
MAVDLERFFRNQRAKEQVLRELLDHAGVGPGDRVLDVRCGPGMLSLLAAERVGPSGGVWALDNRADVLEFLAQQQAERGLAGIRTVLADMATFDLPHPGINRFVIADALHRTPGAETLVRRLFEVLPSGARGAISDYDPAVPRRLGAQTADRLPPGAIRGWLEAAGFRIVEAWRPPDEHYAFIAQRP